MIQNLIKKFNAKSKVHLFVIFFVFGLSGSFSLLGYSLNEISNDTTLGDESSTALTTESASKAYVQTHLGSVTEPNTTDIYLRKNFNWRDIYFKVIHVFLSHHVQKMQAKKTKKMVNRVCI